MLASGGFTVTLEAMAQWFPNLSNPGILGLQLPQTLASIAGVKASGNHSPRTPKLTQSWEATQRHRAVSLER